MNINTGIQAAGDVNIKAEGDINDSFNFISEVNSSGDKAELAERLTELHSVVTQLIKQLPTDDDKEKAARSLKIIAEEAKKPKPDRAWYEVSANGLLEAAKAVVSLTEPVTKAVKAVLAILTGTPST